MSAVPMNKSSELCNVEAERMRKKYPDKVPVICIDKSGLGGDRKPSKLLVPLVMTGKGLRKAVFDKAQWSEVSVIMVGRIPQTPLQDDALVSELDKEHKHDDGFLYVTCHTKEQAQQFQKPSANAVSSGNEKSAPAAASNVPLEAPFNAPLAMRNVRLSLDTFHLPDQDPEDKEQAYDESRLSRVLKKNPGCVPVRCRQEADSKLGLPSFDKKLLAPGNMFFSEFTNVARNYVPRPTDSNAKLFVDGVVLEFDAKMTEVYDEYKADDGLLYMAYGKPMPIEEQNAEDTVAQEEEVFLKENVLKELEDVRLAAESELEQLRKASLQEVIELHVELEKKRSELECHSSTLQSLSQEVTEKDAELEQVQKGAESEIADLRGELAKMAEKFEQVAVDREQIQVLQQQVHDREKDLEQAQAESVVVIADLKVQLETMGGALEISRFSAEEMVGALRQQVSEKETEVRDLNADLQDMIAESREWKDTRATAQKDVLSLKAKVSVLEAEREVGTASAAGELADLQFQMQVMVANHESEIAAADCALQQFDQQGKKQEAELLRAKEESSSRLNELQALRMFSQMSGTEAKEMTSALQHKVSKQEAELKHARAESAKHSNEATALRDQLEKMKKEDDWVVLGSS